MIKCRGKGPECETCARYLVQLDKRAKVWIVDGPHEGDCYVPVHERQSDPMLDAGLDQHTIHSYRQQKGM